ncbi:MAG: hypothetical protein AB8E15_05000 [Bdellovibrionales bacterium]
MLSRYNYFRPIVVGTTSNFHPIDTSLFVVKTFFLLCILLFQINLDAKDKYYLIGSLRTLPQAINFEVGYKYILEKKSSNLLLSQNFTYRVFASISGDLGLEASYSPSPLFTIFAGKSKTYRFYENIDYNCDSVKCDGVLDRFHKGLSFQFKWNRFFGQARYSEMDISIKDFDGIFLVEGLNLLASGAKDKEFEKRLILGTELQNSKKIFFLNLKNQVRNTGNNSEANYIVFESPVWGWVSRSAVGIYRSNVFKTSGSVFLNFERQY